MSLPGLAGVAGMFASNSPFVAYAEGTASLTTTLVINKPTGTVDGDLMVAIMSALGDGDTWTGATGWTEDADVARALGVNAGIRVAHKIASSEGASYTFTMAGSDSALGQILTFRGYSYDTIGSTVGGSGDGAYAIPAITSAGGIIIAAEMAHSGTSPTQSTPTGMTLVRQTTVSSSHAISTWWQYVNAGSTGTRSTTVGGSTGDNVGIMVGIK